MCDTEDFALSSYEALVNKNIEENRRVLISLGLFQEKCPIKETKPQPELPNGISVQNKKLALSTNNSAPIEHHRRIQTRRSSLLWNPERKDEYIEEGENYTPRTRPKVVREATFGEIEGVSVGDWWLTRMECSEAGVHRPTVAGIHGRAGLGCFSIALSGGYEDDLDCGEYFTYTGSGGRDLTGTKSKPKNLRTAPQSKDQVFQGINAALAENVEKKLPVRVIRGFKSHSPYAPDLGYRYDGLYSVEKYWSAIGLAGFKVCKFALKRLPFQDPPPWLFLSPVTHLPNGVSLNEEQSLKSEGESDLNTVDNNEHIPPSQSPKMNEETRAELHKEHIPKPLPSLSPKMNADTGATFNNEQSTLAFASQSPKMNRDIGATLNDENFPMAAPSQSPIDVSPDKRNNDWFEGFSSPVKPKPLHPILDSVKSPVAESLKQVSILKYFQPQTKSPKLTPVNRISHTVNPKALRNNRFTSLWTVQTDTNVSKAMKQTKRKSTPKSYVPKSPQKPTDVEESSESLKENITVANSPDRKPMPSLPQCYVKLMRDDCFMGWDCFHGFDDGQ